MLEGTVVRISADASEPQAQRGDGDDDEAPPPAISPFKAIVKLSRQSLRSGDKRMAHLAWHAGGGGAQGRRAHGDGVPVVTGAGESGERGRA